MQSAFEEFRAIVMAAPALRSELMDEYRPEAFAVLCQQRAAGYGIDLPLRELTVLPDPLGLSQFSERAPNAKQWPPQGWLPDNLFAGAEGAGVEWKCFSNIALDRPFFQEATNEARSRPFNQLFAWRMRLADVLDTAPVSRPPAGMIFHLSRCGSTLVHRMISATQLATALSEAPSFDAALQFCYAWDVPQESKLKLLRAMAAGLANSDGAKPLVLKLNAWHILSWPLLRAAFPGTPAIFLHRDPVEVMVSQQQQRGVQAIPQPGIAMLCGIANYAGIGIDEYFAHYLAASCRAAAEAVLSGAVIAIGYDTLPESVFARILPHFGLRADETAQIRMRSVAGYNAKVPNTAFIADIDEKRLAASPTLHLYAQEIAEPAYRELCAIAG